MKYFKFTQISEETGKSWLIEQPISGPSLPRILIPGLGYSVRIDEDYWVGTADDTAVANPDNYIFEITKEEYSDFVKRDIVLAIALAKNNIYQQEKQFRDEVFGTYHETATTAGIYKYEQAKALILDANAAAADVRLEATTRGVTAAVMAQRIITNHEDFRAKDAKISGIRGKMLDRYNSYVFNSDDPVAMFEDYLSREQIGEQRANPNNENSELIPVYTNKYALDFATRYKFA
jgi:hypothetical protein